MRLRMMNKALYLLSWMIMISIISSCANNGDKQSIGTQTPAPDSEKVTLKVVQSLMTPQRTAELKKLIGQFELQNANIRIQLITPTEDNADDAILTMLEDNQDIDIVEVRDITAHTYASRGLLVSLERYLPEWSNYSLISEDARLMARDIGDITYYIPNSLYQVQLYYRKDWFDAKALQAPETWEQLYFVGKQLTKPELGRYGFAFRGGPGAANTLTSMIQDYNGDGVSSSDSMFELDGTTIFAGERAAEALELYRKLYVETSHPKSIDWGFNDQVNAFANGEAAMLIQDSDIIPQIREKLKNNEWATAPLPTGPQGISHYNVGAAGWGIALQSKHRDEAWAFITYLSSAESNRAFADAAGLRSIYSGAIDDEKYSTSPYAPYILMANDPIHYRGVKRPSHYTNFSEYYQMGTELGRQYLQNTLSTEALLETFDDFWQRQRNLANRQ